MEREDDVQLIHAVLSGDDSAFDILVEKYQRSVHALAWRKIGDFHYAEEITQDTFLRAYQNLSTLKNPSSFPGWLRAITNRLCKNWQQRKPKIEESMQSLEDTPMKEVAESAYARYEVEQRETEATEHRFEIVKKLLEKLSEGQQIVMTLYYLDEMTAEEIGEFLGVSAQTVWTRLHRARKRLEEEEELLIQEVLGSVQISASIKQNIMRKIVDMTPTPSPKMNPSLPWVAIGTALVVATLLILSVSNQSVIYFAHNDEDTKDEKSFAADFTITLGTHGSGVDLLEALIKEKCQISLWSMQALGNPNFPVVAEETTVDIVVVSMLEMGFAAGELATLDTIYDRAKQMGLETCPVETAAQLRLSFLDQQHYATVGRLGKFFVASEPFVLTPDGFPKIFSVVRGDIFPHPEIGIGLWLIANGTVEAEDAERPGRLFNASNEDRDHGGRFAFVVQKNK
ncbi:MAG: RNA polymerase sigma factor [Candidatus Poribacteria bacterium]|nr:RNA polymerase sigma factor [Candidatus Poribacteria bacterium]